MRNRKLELFSFVATVMVVYIHVKGTDIYGFDRFVQLLLKGVSGTAVSFFFCVSGYMLAKHVTEEGWWRTAVRRRLKTIVVPYLFWNVTAFAVLSALRLTSNALHHAVLLRNISSMWVVLGLDLTQMPENFPLWYLRTLMFYVLICPPFVRIVHKSRFLGVMLVVMMFVAESFLGCWLDVSSPFYGFMRVFLAPSSFGCFLVGIILRAWPFSVNRTCSFTFLLLGFVGVVFGAFCDGYGVPLSPILSGPLTRLPVLLLLSGLWGVAPEKTASQSLVGLAMPIYVEHVIVLSVLGTIFNLFIPTPVLQNVVVMLVQVGVCVLICVTMTKFLKRRLPGFSNVIFGGR